jgi:hypothetical protein
MGGQVQSLASIRRRGTRHLIALALLSATAAVTAAPCAHAAAGSGVISGTVFYDTNRNGARDAGETGLANQGINLLDSSGQTQLAFTSSDASGHYSFSALADGNYRVVYDTADWWSLRQNWVPTTTGSIFPRISVSLSGSATANFGWRAIVRSTTYSAPISSYVGSNGLRVSSYDDVVAAKDIYDDLVSGSLVGPEAAYETVAFDYVDNFGSTSTSVSGSAGSFGNYLAVSEVPYISWLDGGDQLLFHEYGLAWSGYYAYIVQQDPSLAGYLSARGIQDDPRLDTSHAWNRNELISEDYRQLFGTPNAQAAPQENRDLPAAAAVPGLRDYLAGTFTQPPPITPTASPTPAPAPPPPPALALSSLAMSPNPVKTSGTASFSLSAAAAVTVVIKDGKGNTVRTLLQDTAEAGGQVSAKWDRKNALGQRVKSGAYTVAVDALDAYGQHASTSASFSVS